MLRRDFLLRGGLAIGGALAAQKLRVAAASPAAELRLDDWSKVRALFNLAPDWAQFAGFFLASHPKPVRDAIDVHRRGLDANPVGYFIENVGKAQTEVHAAAAEYLGGQPNDIALTDSTTMGLGLLYGGLKLRPGQEVLTTTHDHYSTDESIRMRAERTGAKVARVALYDDPAAASESEIVTRLTRAVKRETRIVAVTWVHSSTGVRLPIRAMADALGKLNAKRAEADRVLLCVDGVHGLGACEEQVAELGCDFFVAGCHKWMFGPRGTGLVWGHPRAWPVATATIPNFDLVSLQIWEKEIAPQPIPPGLRMSPGGFHSFEHRWALAEAFKLHLRLGRPRVAERIRQLNRQIKEGLKAMKHVRLRTPIDDKLSAGINCFEVAGLRPAEVVARLFAKKIVASDTPYATKYVRLAALPYNTPAEIERALREVRALG
jgi:selenocysteine lyase/cysteine desulfurase